MAGIAVRRLTTGEEAAAGTLFTMMQAVFEEEIHQRLGVATALVADLRVAARQISIEEIFVPADNEDTGALAFYLSLGATPAPVTHFTI